MQSPELTPTPSARIFIPPGSPAAISEARISGACGTDARDHPRGERNVTTSPVVIAPIERLKAPRWPALVITLALLLTLLWTGTFVWLIYQMCRLLLSALF